MALNFQQVYEKIRLIGKEAQLRRQTVERQRQRAWELFQAWQEKTALLSEKVERARGYDPSLRCAIPLEAPLGAAFDPAPAPVSPILLAADGSQIVPDRHAAVLYSLVNIGIIRLRSGSGATPEVFTESLLLFDDELYTESGMLTEEAIALRRDLAERRKLLELARQTENATLSCRTASDSLSLRQICLALTDGPLELWGAKNSDEQEYHRSLEHHLSILSQMQEQGIVPAGYVDKPTADLVVRLLEIALLPEEDMRNLRQYHPLRGATDLWLFGRLLKSGQRSAVFGLQSSSRPHYTGALAIHFFYLNVGGEKHPALARVEFPQWVAEDPEALNVLHTALLEQCRLMGAWPYPYILHRAHEIAVVRFEEKQQVEAMLALELRRSGGEVGEKSGKQLAKDNR
ncbi:MAG: DNA double-strand break repair nuclease NurA [Anaerolineales bacterium]|nr:DNA double-strand break repair nuclease NurA [Anaerolineales bacterium]MDW8227558.1 DNA double-strand break repair nuclease NurA [Anaerolineales bacterium]